jgi:glutamate-1-semialdehyde 2,1-aminomutase
METITRIWSFLMNANLSRELFKPAKLVSPYGIHSDFRYAFPHFFSKADGAFIEDIDGNRFLDYHMAFGSVVLGHRNQRVLESVKAQLENGDIWSMGSNLVEVEVAEKIIEHVPSAEQVRFCNSGSEATYHALRLARALTRKKKLSNLKEHITDGMIISTWVYSLRQTNLGERL